MVSFNYIIKYYKFILPTLKDLEIKYNVKNYNIMLS